MGEVNVAGDSLLTFYDAKTGKLITSIKTGLSDIVGLAYHPKSGKLYAVDFSWVDPTKGGLYRLDVSGTIQRTAEKKIEVHVRAVWDSFHFNQNTTSVDRNDRQGTWVYWRLD